MQYSKAAGARQPIFVVDFLSHNPSSLSLISDGRAKYYIVRVPTGEIVESNDGGFGVRAVTDRTVNAKRQVVLHGDSDGDPFYLPYAPYGLVRTLVDYWGTTYLGVSLRAGEAVSYDITVSQITAVPEPASWAMMIAGFAMAGCAARRSRNPTTRNHRKLNQTTRHELL